MSLQLTLAAAAVLSVLAAASIPEKPKAAQAKAQPTSQRIARCHVTILARPLADYWMLAEGVASGTVLSSRTSVSNSGLVLTHWLVQRTASMKGVQSDQFEVSTYGGRCGEHLTMLDGFSGLEIGRELVLFLCKGQGPGSFGLLGLSGGVLSVEADGSLRGNHSREVKSLAELTLYSAERTAMRHFTKEGDHHEDR